MSTEITLSSDKNQFSNLAQAMGMGHDMVESKQKSNLARLKIDHFGVDGETEIKGTHEGNLLHGTFTNSQINQLNNYHRYMNI